jgi:hypothetical protein
MELNFIKIGVLVLMLFFLVDFSSVECNHNLVYSQLVRNCGLENYAESLISAGKIVKKKEAPW